MTNERETFLINMWTDIDMNQVNFAYKMFVGSNDRSTDNLDYMRRRSRDPDHNYKIPGLTIYFHNFFHLVYELDFIEVAFVTMDSKKHIIYPLRKEHLENENTRSITWLK